MLSFFSFLNALFFIFYFQSNFHCIYLLINVSIGYILNFILYYIYCFYLYIILSSNLINN
ncbi:hypothetical protein H8356DRAFT_1626388 [Neocallimastix lanati (nom. inval.)]|nr:hypothetical protein H8356DRAFT_1626388 [Neocallimastix sp. JGI-2020a]